MWFVRIKLLSSSKDFNSTFHFINSIITHYLVHANNFSEATTDAHSRSSRKALMATKKNFGEQIFLRRPPYIGYAYAELNFLKTAHPIAQLYLDSGSWNEVLV